MLRFLGILLRFLRLEVSVWFLNHREGGLVFYQVYINSTVEICNRLHEFKEICKRFREFEETEISRQSCRVDCE
jgi:hypothetical protein